MTYIVSWEEAKERDNFKLARMRLGKGRGFDYIRCRKSDNQKVLVKGSDIKERWKEYFNKLFRKIL